MQRRLLVLLLAAAALESSARNLKAASDACSCGKGMSCVTVYSYKRNTETRQCAMEPVCQGKTPGFCPILKSDPSQPDVHCTFVAEGKQKFKGELATVVVGNRKFPGQFQCMSVKDCEYKSPKSLTCSLPEWGKKDTALCRDHGTYTYDTPISKSEYDVSRVCQCLYGFKGTECESQLAECAEPGLWGQIQGQDACICGNKLTRTPCADGCKNC